MTFLKTLKEVGEAEILPPLYTIEINKNNDMDFIRHARESIDNIILSQPEHIIPLQQVEKVQKIIDKIINYYKKGGEK